MLRFKLFLVSLVFALSSMILLAQTVTFVEGALVQCGDIIEGEFTVDWENHTYDISLEAGDAIEFYVIPLGVQLETSIYLLGPTGLTLEVNRGMINSSGEMTQRRLDPQPRISMGALAAGGTYQIGVTNFSTNFSSPDDPGGVGVYTLYITCTLRNGTVVEAGSILEETVQSESPVVQSAFSGYGFPGFASVDFSTGIEIPLALAQPQTVPLGSDVALYTYGATAGETVTLSVSRVSGDISIGVTVINKDTNEILFVGGLPSSNNLSVELTFPVDGTYTNHV